jgi:hypothetical protein
MRAFRLLWPGSVILCFAIVLAIAASGRRRANATPAGPHLGFDRNDYPGDDAMEVLRKTFSFTSYWIGPPPGEKKSTWNGKRALLESKGFGFVVLFNAQKSKALRGLFDARQKGLLDARTAGQLAREEGFTAGTVIFLDVEEGGRLPAQYHEYLKAWALGLTREGFRAGVYCSGIPVDESGGGTITTAQDIAAHEAASEFVFWVYNDACPPSPGCSFSQPGMKPEQSGFARAAVWQFAQSPRRAEFTAHCPANYAADKNCYAPGDEQHKWFLDGNVSGSGNPSGKVKK